jgi:hypothetical protein
MNQNEHESNIVKINIEFEGETNYNNTFKCQSKARTRSEKLHSIAFKTLFAPIRNAPPTMSYFEVISIINYRAKQFETSIMNCCFVEKYTDKVIGHEISLNQSIETKSDSLIIIVENKSVSEVSIEWPFAMYNHKDYIWPPFNWNWCEPINKIQFGKSLEGKCKHCMIPVGTYDEGHDNKIENLVLITYKNFILPEFFQSEEIVEDEIIGNVAKKLSSMQDITVVYNFTGFIRYLEYSISKEEKNSDYVVRDPLFDIIIENPRLLVLILEHEKYNGTRDKCIQNKQLLHYYSDSDSLLKSRNVSLEKLLKDIEMGMLKKK